MKTTSRGISTRGYLFPRTSTKPIDMATYLEMQARSRVVDGDRLTDEFKAWYDRMRNNPKYKR